MTTIINADINICFDLARSIDLHTISTKKTNEKAIAGVTTGLIGLNETVTWQATHFGVRQKLTSRITAYERPFHFRDEQIKGTFDYIKHDHLFRTHNNTTIMTDRFDFGSPFGVLGNIFNSLVLTAYLKKFLEKRNQVIKEYAENGTWKMLLRETP
ncbi:MAG: SRPBCC family protein [Sphingobacterium sp.]